MTQEKTVETASVVGPHLTWWLPPGECLHGRKVYIPRKGDPSGVGNFTLRHEFEDQYSLVDKNGRDYLRASAEEVKPWIVIP